MNSSFINSYFFGVGAAYRAADIFDPSLSPWPKKHVPKVVSDPLFNSIRLDDIKGCHEFLHNLFSSIFIHDLTYIKTNDIFILLTFLGYDNTTSLLKTDIIKLIDDRGLNPIIHIDEKNGKHIGLFQDGWVNMEKLDKPSESDAFVFDSSFNHLEFHLRKNSLPEKNLNLILNHTERSSVTIDVDEVISKLKIDLKYDFQNNNLCTHLGLTNDSILNATDDICYKLVRLAQSNQALIYAATLNLENLIFEAGADTFLKVKYPNLKTSYSTSSIDTFNYVSQKIGIPNFYETIRRGVLSIDEFLELRSQKGAQKFRNWLFNKHFEKEDVIEYLIHDIKNDKKKQGVAQFLKWAFVNSIGLFNSIAGLSLSAFDTFVYEKLTQGWSPSLYLNNDLKILLDSKIEIQEKQNKLERLKKYFPTTGRNDACPCGSGNKFKRCCGK